MEMGFFDGIRTISGIKLLNGDHNNEKHDLTTAVKIPFDLSLASVYKISEAVKNEGAQKLKQYLPAEPDRREKLTRIATNIGKFAVESAINDSLKGVRGAVQVYKIVQEGLKDQSPSLSSNEKKTPEILTVKELEAKMEKMQEEMNKIKAENNTRVALAHTDEPKHMKKISAEPDKTPDLLIPDKKRVMIRSRL